MISRRKFLGTSAVAAVAASIGLPFMVTPAFAATNPQRITRGSPFPVYVNGSGTSQSMAHFAYVDQTQFTPAANGGNQRQTLLGVSN